ncbi:MAG: hypothetical protein AAFW70_26995 [Cyanobacteria bacterium J06635_10]
MALIVNSSGFSVWIICFSKNGKKLGHDGGIISPGCTRYIKAETIKENGGFCICKVYGEEFILAGQPAFNSGMIGGFYNAKRIQQYPITKRQIKPHGLYYFNGKSLTTNSKGLRHTDNRKRKGW